MEATARSPASRTDFFWSAGGLNYFPEIKEIKPPSTKTLARKSGVLKALGSGPWAFAASDRARSSIYFPGTLHGGRGWSKVRDRQAGTGTSREFPQNSENFFWSSHEHALRPCRPSSSIEIEPSDPEPMGIDLHWLWPGVAHGLNLDCLTQ
jgi:hypothetical protein